MSSAKITVIETGAEDEEKAQESFAEFQGQGGVGGGAWRQDDAGLGQKEAAEVFGVHQPRISDLMRGKIDKFTIDVLVNMLARVGKSVEFRAA